MKGISFIVGLFAMAGLTNTALSEEQSANRGLVTSSACPLTCGDLSVPESKCREWTAGSRCYVEDMRSPAGHRSLARLRGRMGGLQGSSVEGSSIDPDATAAIRSGRANETRQQLRQEGSIDDTRRGLVTSASCPFTCVDAQVPQEFCRESQIGTTCQVEDLRHAPGHRSMIRVP